MRVVVLLMDGKREDALVAAKNLRRAVSLVDVRINHHGSFDQTVKLKPANSDRHIVDRAESLSVIGAGVMESAPDIRRPAIRERMPPRQNRAARRKPARPDQLL